MPAGDPGDRRRHPGRAGALPGTPRRPGLGEPVDLRILRRAGPRPVAGGPRWRGPRPARSRPRWRPACAACARPCGSMPAPISPALGRTPEALKDIARIEALWARGAGGAWRALPVRAALRHGRCDVRPGGRPLPDLAAGAVGGDPGLYGRRAGASAGERWYAEALAEPAAWLLDEYETRPRGMSTAVALDHVGVAARDLGPLAAAYERLGFALSPVAQQSGRRSPGRPVELFGSGNRCAFLRHGYIELIAILDATRFANGAGSLRSRAMPGCTSSRSAMEDEAGQSGPAAPRRRRHPRRRLSGAPGRAPAAPPPASPGCPCRMRRKGGCN